VKSNVIVPVGKSRKSNLLVPFKVCIVALAGSIVQDQYPGRLFYIIPYSCTDPIGVHLPTREYWEHGACAGP